MLFCFTVTSTVPSLAVVLFVFQHRFASADPMLPAFSGELLAMVIIGGMRSFLGPALGALFYVLFREFLSQWTPDWLLYFGLLFVGFTFKSEEHTSELQSLMRISYAVFCLKKKKIHQ